MAKSKVDDRLARLQQFGSGAGAQPAAKALEAPSAPAPTAVKASPELAPLPPAQTVRNVAFSPHDLEQVNRLEAVLLSIKSDLGIRVTFADVIRLALYTATPTTEQAVRTMQTIREQDGRLKQNKKRYNARVAL